MSQQINKFNMINIKLMSNVYQNYQIPMYATKTRNKKSELKTTKGGGGQKSPVLRRHSLLTAP